MDTEQNWSSRLSEIVERIRIDGLGDSEYCSTCRTTKPTAEFHKNKSTSNGLQTECRLCQNARSQTRYHGMSVEEYGNTLARQKGCCAICGVSAGVKRLHIDHDHAVQCQCDRSSCTICRRGLLCGNCNTAIGMLKDDTQIMTNAIAYIERWRNTHSERRQYR